MIITVYQTVYKLIRNTIVQDDAVTVVKGAFTMTDNGTEPIKWVSNPLTSVTVSVSVSLSVQYEHLFTVLYNPFLPFSVSMNNPKYPINSCTPLPPGGQFTPWWGFTHRAAV